MIMYVMLTRRKLIQPMRAGYLLILLPHRCGAQELWQQETQKPGSGARDVWHWPGMDLRLRRPSRLAQKGCVPAAPLLLVEEEAERGLVAVEEVLLAELPETFVALPGPDAPADAVHLCQGIGYSLERSGSVGS